LAQLSAQAGFFTPLLKLLIMQKNCNTMATLLIVAHAPLASSLQLVANHAYADCAGKVLAVDIPAGASLEAATQVITQTLATLAAHEVLILADVFGATPCNAALAAADGLHVRVVAGVNVPMLWRSLCYVKLPLADLVQRASEGGVQGIMQVATPRRQNQASRQNPPHPDASDPNSDQ
jgi:mannose PTS system EIIA component